jgi:hypothetical protein
MQREADSKQQLVKIMHTLTEAVQLRGLGIVVLRALRSETCTQSRNSNFGWGDLTINKYSKGLILLKRRYGCILTHHARHHSRGAFLLSIIAISVSLRLDITT